MRRPPLSAPFSTLEVSTYDDFDRVWIFIKPVREIGTQVLTGSRLVAPKCDRGVLGNYLKRWFHEIIGGSESLGRKNATDSIAISTRGRGQRKGCMGQVKK